MELQIRAVIAGIFFGIWPLLMNRSGLTGNVSGMVMSAVSLVCIIPFALSNLGPLADANWVMGIAGGVTAALGILAFNGMLAKATPQNVSTMFVLMIVVQVASPVVYSAVMNGGVTMKQGIGFVFAAIAAVLLTI